jgi:hypothetical protein
VRRRLLWAVVGLSLVLTVASVVLLVLTLSTPVPAGNFGFRGFSILFAVAFAAVGSVIVSRRPENVIGWLLVAAGLASAIQAFTELYAMYAVLAHPGSLPAGRDVAWVQAWIWMVPVALLGGFVFPLFPDGKLPSPRWRWIPWLAGAGMVLGIIGTGLAQGPLQNFRTIRNPFGVQGNPFQVFGGGGFPFIASVVAGCVSVFVRFGRAGGTERQQVKWLAFSGVFVAVMLLPAGLTASASSTAVLAKAFQDALLVGFAAIPLAIGVAVLRYRLYEIDRIINRTLVYGLLTALLGGVYVGLAVGLGSVVSSNQNSLVIAGSTLVVAALFTPARRRIQALIDRRFYRRRYDAGHTLEVFSARLRDEVDLDELREHLLRVVGETMQPARAQLWLRPAATRNSLIATVPAAVTALVTISER